MDKNFGTSKGVKVDKKFGSEGVIYSTLLGDEWVIT